MSPFESPEWLDRCRAVKTLHRELMAQGKVSPEVAVEAARLMIEFAGWLVNMDPLTAHAALTAGGLAAQFTAGEAVAARVMDPNDLTRITAATLERVAAAAAQHASRPVAAAPTPKIPPEELN